MFAKFFTSFFAFFALFLSMASISSAKITGISGDGHFAKQGFSYPITFFTENFSQSVSDYTVVLGWSNLPIATGGVGQIGFSTIDLLALNKVITGTGKFTVQVPIDKAVFQLKKNTVFTLTAAVTSLIGAPKDAVISLFNTTITIEP
ncbi:hypothetical protein SISNIDRAFT_456655 [Sistotremastrum niveocremeum HHB9708]|uniref:Uncharacterized protein n=1 Tax=Sistotremastrum niveocremeum HHB9708 TaxID=1314777 RepID=A0A164SE92_9AGAM|nr:hypothetical protein SISNIDRAFT_456655 [Sistotremastrum niveocremeum HHB9708]